MQRVSNPRPPGKSRQWIAAGLLAGISLAVFARALDCGFVNYDDMEYVTQNGDVLGGLTAGGVRWAFTTFYNSNWHPLTWLSLELDASLWHKPDGRPDPAGFHLTNVLVHAANAALVFLAFRALTGAFWRSAAVALLFAVHPLRVESVAWVSERKDVLSAFFGLLALWAYAGYAAAPSRRRYLAVAGLFVLSLLCKPMLVTLPFLLLVLDWWPLGRLTRQDWLRCVTEKLPLLALTVASSVVTFYAQRAGGAVSDFGKFPLWVRVGNAVVSYVAYLGKTFWPLRLSPFYDHPGEDLPVAEVAGAAALLVVLTLGAVALRRRAPYLLTGWLWYVGTLVPVIGLVQVGMQGMADRYTYLPQVGVLVALCWGVADVAGAWGRSAVAAAAAGVAAVALAVLTRTQVTVWDNPATLWRHALLVTDSSPRSLLVLGGVLEDEGKWEKAKECYRDVLERVRNPREPDAVQALANLGNLASFQGNQEEATRLLQQALELAPGNALAHTNYGNVLFRQGKTEEAIREHERAIELLPVLKGAHFGLGQAEEKLGHDDRAAECYRKAIALQPDFAEAHSGLGNILMRQGREQEGLDHLRSAVRYKPGYAEGHNNLGKALVARGDVDGAARQFELAAKLNPRLATAWYNLGAARLRQNRIEDGLNCLMESEQLDPNTPAYRQALDTIRKQLQDAGQGALIRRVEENRAKRGPAGAKSPAASS
jgi:tetratricopeptide (TPR) repeat protein